MAQIGDQARVGKGSERREDRAVRSASPVIGRWVGRGGAQKTDGERALSADDDSPRSAGEIGEKYRGDIDSDGAKAIRDVCINLHIQRAARVAGRMQDDALRSINLTGGQFMLLVALHRDAAPRIGQVAEELALDRTTLTANLKPLERRELVTISPDATDRRSRRLKLTKQGAALVQKGVKVWVETQKRIERDIGLGRCADLRGELRNVIDLPELA